MNLHCRQGVCGCVHGCSDVVYMQPSVGRRRFSHAELRGQQVFAQELEEARDVALASVLAFELATLLIGGSGFLWLWLALAKEVGATLINKRLHPYLLLRRIMRHEAFEPGSDKLQRRLLKVVDLF